MSAAKFVEPKKRFVGMSLKMYFTPHQTANYISHLASLPLPPHTTLFIIPDFLSLSTASQILSSHLRPDSKSTTAATTTPITSRILLGAQDCFWEDSGAYTGEISPSHLKEVGCSMVELGHAERRRLFDETDEMVAKKIDAVLRNGLIPVICIGEKKRGTVAEAVEEIEPQVSSVLDIAARYADGAEIIFAYEPVWAIGQARPASAEYVTGVAKELRRMCRERREKGVSIIYGGSAGEGTFGGIEEGVDGLFLGRFAHDVGKLKDIINEVAGQ